MPLISQILRFSPLHVPFSPAQKQKKRSAVLRQTARKPLSFKLTLGGRTELGDRELHLSEETAGIRFTLRRPALLVGDGVIARADDKLRRALDPDHGEHPERDKPESEMPLPIFVSDYIAGMTDTYAIRCFNDLFKN